mmetsp:Transcript_14150/g.30261  ORF Transcript_14150/g.30261 Transcript_14150/m.30261 type:complete len:207 (+) Transcript_14150:74-694(+)
MGFISLRSKVSRSQLILLAILLALAQILILKSFPKVSLHIQLPLRREIPVTLPARQLHQRLLRHGFPHPVVRHLPQVPVVAAQSKQRLRIPIPLLFVREQPSHRFEHESVRDLIRMGVFFFAGLHEGGVCQVERSSFLHFGPIRRCARGDDGGVTGGIRSTFSHAALVHRNLTIEHLTRPQIMTAERLRLRPVVDHLVVNNGIRSQ